MARSIDEERHSEHSVTGVIRSDVDKSSTLKEVSEGGEEELDPRAVSVARVAIHTDISDSDLQIIMDVALRAYNLLVLLPTRSTWRKEEGSRRELERDVERIAMCDMARYIKKEIENKIGGCWHVIYGHDFATFVTHMKLSFCHFSLEGAHVVAWRHGR